MSLFTGGCFCGAVRIQIDAPPIRSGICHCLDCRKRQGAIFHTFGVFPTSAVKITGETRAFKSKHFCPVCGSPLFDLWGEEFELHAGCLDEPDRLRPAYESWTIRRESWLPPFDVAARHARDRD